MVSLTGLPYFLLTASIYYTLNISTSKIDGGKKREKYKNTQKLFVTLT